MAGGAWGLLCLTFSSLTARGWCESQSLEMSYLVSATTIPSYFCFGRDKLLVQIPLTATSCHFPNSRQLWSLMPWNQPRLSTNCSQAVFLAPGMYSTQRTWSTNIYQMNETSKHFPSSQRLMEVIPQPSCPRQQLIIPSQLSLNFRDSLDTGLDLGKWWEKRKERSQVFSWVGICSNKLQVIWLHSVNKTRVCGECGEPHRGPML